MAVIKNDRNSYTGDGGSVTDKVQNSYIKQYSNDKTTLSAEIHFIGEVSLKERLKQLAAEKYKFYYTGACNTKETDSIAEVSK